MVIVSILAAIPMMIVGEPPAITLPITVVESPPIMMGYYPHCTGVWRPRPVAIVPLPMMAHWIPIAFHPNKTRSRNNRPDTYDAGRRRRTDFDTNGYLGEEDSSKQEREREKLIFHHGTTCRVLAISQVSAISIRYRSSYRVNCARPNVKSCKIAIRLLQAAVRKTVDRQHRHRGRRPDRKYQWEERLGPAWTMAGTRIARQRHCASNNWTNRDAWDVGYRRGTDPLGRLSS
jgi:hypothetical protein